MSAQLIDGKTLAAEIRNELKEEIRRLAPLEVARPIGPSGAQARARLLTGRGIIPGLAVLLIGDDPASHTYVRLKEKAATEIGIHFEKILLPKNIDEELVLVKIDELNRRDNIHGILVQLPLPKQLHEDHITSAIFPEKDVDGFHPQNIAALLDDKPRIVPGLAQGIMRLIDATKESLAGKHAVILANSDIFAMPLKKLLADRNVIVKNIVAPKLNYSITQLLNYNIVISALGKPHAITKEMLKNGAIVIDVGTTLVDGKILGDVHPNVAEKAGWLTPVPGGVGPMTVAMLLQNVVVVAKQKIAY